MGRSAACPFVWVMESCIWARQSAALGWVLVDAESVTERVLRVNWPTCCPVKGDREGRETWAALGLNSLAWPRHTAEYDLVELSSLCASRGAQGPGEDFDVPRKSDLNSPTVGCPTVFGPFANDAPTMRMKSPALPIWLFVSALAAASLLATACTSSSSPAPIGGEGEGCIPDCAGLFCAAPFCEGGLLCNTGPPSWTCQQPNSVPKGGACTPGSCGLCGAGLVCTYNANAATVDTLSTCQPGNCAQLGESCGSISCEPGLSCNGGVCYSFFAAGAGTDAASGSDGGTD
jgi:hypothetical protein